MEDVLRPGLLVVCVGINPSLVSVDGAGKKLHELSVWVASRRR